MSLNVETTLLVFGIILLMLTLSCLMLGWLPGLPTKVQKLKGFGIELEISVLSLIFIIGLTLCVPSIYWRIGDFQRQLSESRKTSEQQISELKGQVKTITEQLEATRQISLAVRVFLTASDKIEVNDLKCWYRRSDDPQKLHEAPVVAGKASEEVEVILNSLSRNCGLIELTILDRKTQRRWRMSDTLFYPLYPVMTLVRKD